jgi:hypothetical protein
MRVKMRLYNENEARTKGPHIATTGYAYGDNTSDLSKSLIALQLLRDHALAKATKYKWDPWLSRAHEEYLDYLNNVLNQWVV